MADNTGGEWKTKRMEVVGFGRRWGTSPLGAKPSGFNLTTVPYPASAQPSHEGSDTDSAASASLHCSGAYADPS